MPGREGGSGCLTGCIVVAVLALLVPLAFLGFFRDMGLIKPTGTSLTASSGCLSPRAPKVNSEEEFAAAIEAYIKKLKPSSPLIGLGNSFVSSGTKAGVNPAFIVAIARKESVFGTSGWAAEHANNPFGRKATGSQPYKVSPKGVHWYAFNSFEEAITEQGPFLKRRYLDKGLDTIEKIMHTYAPENENNTRTYIEEVNKWIGEIIGLAGTAVSCGGDSSAELGDIPPGTDVGKCENAREVPKAIPAKHNRLAHTVLVRKLELLWQKNKTWRLTEACPPSQTHQDRNHYNGRAVDIAIFPPGTATEPQIAQLLADVKAVGFDDILDEYHKDTKFKSAGHIHLEWHGN